MRFEDRAHAGRELARLLRDVVAPPCVVAAIPRGGVAVAQPIARALGAPLALAHAHKLSAARAPEFAFGAVDEDGSMVLDQVSVEGLGLGDEEISAICERTLAAVRARVAALDLPALASWLPRRVILVDDGLATGLTMRAALRHARRHGATEVVVAVPCASREAAGEMRLESDRFVCPVVDPRFEAVGAYYQDFAPVSESTLAALLACARASGPVGPGPGTGP